MYTVVLTLHSWIRWAALPLGIVATFAALFGSDTQQPSPGSQGSTGSQAADRWGRLLLMALDTQMLLGLLLYVALSPFTGEAFKDFGGAMRNPLLRFWAVEHIGTMILAVVAAHAGKALGGKAQTPHAKRLRYSIGFGLSTILMVVAIPWPGRMNGRPLFRI
jgi:hypothetical protein